MKVTNNITSLFFWEAGAREKHFSFKKKNNGLGFGRVHKN